MTPQNRKITAVLAALLLSAAGVAQADLIVGTDPDAPAATVFGDGVLATTDPTFHHPNASAAGTGVQYYDVYAFTVDVTGSYTFELSSRNTTGTPSNGLDTFEAIYANVFNPVAPGAGIGFDDDFTGALSVLPGPYAGIGLTGTATGFTGAQPSSQNLNLALTAGTAYFYVVTSFRNTDYVPTGSSGRQTGTYYFGITGPGNIVIVPEPSTLALLGLGAAGLGLFIKRKRTIG